MQQIEVKCVDYTSTKTACDCACCSGKCNHTATPCHNPRLVTSVWEITLPDGQTVRQSLSWKEDDWKRTVTPSPLDAVVQALEEAGYRVFIYSSKQSDFYHYSERRYCSVTPVRGDIFVVSGVDGIRVRGPWFGHTDSHETTNTLVVVPPSVTEAEWEISEWGRSNVPHNVEVECEDEETGEIYIMLEQCWCHREWERRERVVYRGGEVRSELLRSWEKCHGRGESLYVKEDA